MFSLNYSLNQNPSLACRSVAVYSGQFIGLFKLSSESLKVMSFCLSPPVPKHQDGGMYKPPYSGYPFLMLPEPYLPNGPVSPSVSVSLKMQL